MFYNFNGKVIVMKKERMMLLVFLGLSMLQILSVIIYLLYSDRNSFNPESYDLPLFIMGFIPVLFLIIVVFKYTKNIQYKSYAILLLVVPSTNIMGIIYFYFHNIADIYVTMLYAIMYGVILFFAVSSIKLYVKHKHKSTLVIALSVLIIRYVLYSGPVRNYIYSNCELGIFYSHLLFITA